MFRFFKRKQQQQGSSRPPEGPSYPAEFERRKRELYDKFAVEDTPYDELLEAMAAVEHEINHVGGGNWNAGNYDAYLDVIRGHLTADPQFSPEQRQHMASALDNIATLGAELRRDGQSSRDVEGSVEYLVARVVDWCRTHEPESSDDT